MNDIVKADLFSNDRKFIISLIPDLSEDIKIRCDLMDISIKSSFGALRGKSELSISRLKEIIALESLLSSLKDKKEWIEWGIGNYRSEGPFMKCYFQGDGLGHFNVTVEIAEDNMKYKDEFISDQSCIRLFLDDIRNIMKLIKDREV